MSSKKNLILFIAFLATFSAFSQDKMNKEAYSADYTFTNTVPSTEIKNNPPSHLLDFLSIYKNHKIVLAWKTANEKSLKGFKLERSEDGKKFEAITFEKAKGNYSSGAYYEICDQKAAAEVGYIYKLSEIAENGVENVIRIVENTAQNKQCKMSLDNYIVENKLVMNIEYKNVNEIILRVVDEKGKVILIDHPKDEQNVLDLEWLEKGVYSIKIATSEFELQKKIVKK